MIHVLTVCTGNICRSPFAERMLQTELDAMRPGFFSVRSAGTESMVGDSMEEESAELMASLGGSSEGFASRQLTPELLASTDIILTMTVAHRDAVVRMSPRMLKRAYTLVEFARILKAVRLSKSPELFAGATDADVHSRWTKLPELASLFRPASKPSAAGDDVIDPYRQDAQVHQRMVEEIMPAIEEITAFERWCGQLE